MAATIQLTKLYQPGIWSIAQDKLKLDTFLTLFVNSIVARVSSAEIVRSTIGINYTYIAQFDKEKFVLKFEHIDRAFNEKFCARILKELGFFTPIVRLIKHDKRNGKNILMTFHESLNDLDKDELNDNYALFMPAFEAKSMLELIQASELAKLSPQKLSMLFRKIGEIAVYDLLYGNNDRFFRLDGSVEAIFSACHFNCGNIMLASQSEGDLQVLAIDNGSSSGLVNQLPWVKTQSSLVYEHFKKAFRYAVKEGHAQEFANHILRGSTICINQFPECFSQADAEKFLIEGANQGCQQLKQLDREKFIALLAPHAKGTLAQKTLDLIKENLSILQD
jgi:hypothetical protein